MIAAVAALVLAHQRPPDRYIGGEKLDKIALMSHQGGWAKLPIGERMGRIGMAFVGTPYVAFTLETDEPIEYCTVNLEGLDCVTFFESCLNIARIVPKGALNGGDLLEAVRQTRYRGGKQGDYTTRLHYTLDWIDDNVKKGIVEELTPRLPGAEPFTQKVGFMSSHPNSYKQLKANPSLVPVIAQQERAINARKHWYIPTSKIAAIEPLLQTGDIIGLCATQEGIDIAHTGMAYRDDEGVLRFFDATNARGRNNVMLGRRLSQALNPKSHTGIVVARPVEVR
ncbi:DUF1460 domain-containing protein [bacterium]|nr:MAG: DUF1460 domain-containing protein [bacterium]